MIIKKILKYIGFYFIFLIVGSIIITLVKSDFFIIFFAFLSIFIPFFIIYLLVNKKEFNSEFLKDNKKNLTLLIGIILFLSFILKNNNNTTKINAIKSVKIDTKAEEVKREANVTIISSDDLISSGFAMCDYSDKKDNYPDKSLKSNFDRLTAQSISDELNSKMNHWSSHSGYGVITKYKPLSSDMIETDDGLSIIFFVKEGDKIVRITANDILDSRYNNIASNPKAKKMANLLYKQSSLFAIINGIKQLNMTEQANIACKLHLDDVVKGKEVTTTINGIRYTITPRGNNSFEFTADIRN